MPLIFATMKARVIAFYLPQFHPIPENDKFWGKGFTEWTNVAKAKPLFRGHIQPFLPSDLGFYDLRVPEIREQQSQLAFNAGIEGFCYWHYWFGNGKRALESIFDEVLATGKPDYPFCLGWANESWTGKWHGLDNEIIFEQVYPGEQDHIEHFKLLLPAFLDKRYIKVDGRPVFLVYRPELIPAFKNFKLLWEAMALQSGLPGIYWISNGSGSGIDYLKNGFQGYAINNLSSIIESKLKPKSLLRKLLYKFLRDKRLTALDYHEYCSFEKGRVLGPNEIPVVYPGWDSTPRLGRRGYVLTRTNPADFKDLLSSTISKIETRRPQEQLVFIKSWNEWAEGNVLEPSALFSTQFLQACAAVLC